MVTKLSWARGVRSCGGPGRSGTGWRARLHARGCASRPVRTAALLSQAQQGCAVRKGTGRPVRRRALLDPGQPHADLRQEAAAGVDIPVPRWFESHTGDLAAEHTAQLAHRRVDAVLFLGFSISRSKPI